MNAAQHAEQILAAWKRADPVSFDRELSDALQSCQRAQTANYLENEQREVLASVVERLRLVRPPLSGASAARAEPCTAQSLHAGFTLLEHLRQRAAA